MGKIITKSSLEIQQRLTNCIGSEQVLCQDAFKSPNLYPSLSPAPIIIIIIIVLFFFLSWTTSIQSSTEGSSWRLFFQSV